MPPITVSPKSYEVGRTVEAVRGTPSTAVERVIASALPANAGRDLASALSAGAVAVEGRPGVVISTAELTAGLVNNPTRPSIDDAAIVDETSAVEDAFVEMSVAEGPSTSSGHALLKGSATRLVATTWQDFVSPIRAVADLFRSLGDGTFGIQIMAVGAAGAGGMPGSDLPVITSMAFSDMSTPLGFLNKYSRMSDEKLKVLRRKYQEELDTLLKNRGDPRSIKAHQTAIAEIDRILEGRFLFESYERHEWEEDR